MRLPKARISCNTSSARLDETTTTPSGHGQAYRSADCDLTMLRGDANERVDDVLGAVKKRRIGHSLVFLDPEGLEWRWSSMQRLLTGISCDVIVNFPSAGLTRISTRTDTTRETISA